MMNIYDEHFAMGFQKHFAPWQEHPLLFFKGSGRLILVFSSPLGETLNRSHDNFFRTNWGQGVVTRLETLLCLKC